MKNGRRSFLKGVAAGGASLLLADFPLMQRLAFAQAPSYKGVTYLTPAYRDSMPAISGFVARLALPAAPFRVEFFDSGSLMKADEQVTGLKTGAIQFMFHTTSYMTEQYPILSLPGMPGICDKLYTHGARLAMGAPLWTLINQVLDRDGLFMLTAGGGVIEPEYIWSGAKRVASLKDIAGKKCRVMSHEAQEIISSFGGRPVRIPSAEMLLALQRGSVDAVVANISTIVSRNLHEQLRYCYKLPVTAYCLAVFFLADFWRRLPEAVKSSFWEAGKWYDANQAPTINDKIYPEESWPLVRKAGVEIFDPPTSEREAFEAKAKPLWAAWKKRVGEENGQRGIDLCLGAP